MAPWGLSRYQRMRAQCPAPPRDCFHPNLSRCLLLPCSRCNPKCGWGGSFSSAEIFTDSRRPFAFHGSSAAPCVLAGNESGGAIAATAR
eukprot:scaffold273796_cov31-Tisochrysis_lutea.AAC.2